MPIPGRYLRLFRDELEPGEQVRSAANADLWLRYRRLALTDRRLLVVERGGVRYPRRGRRVTSIPLGQIASVDVRAGRIQTRVVFRMRDSASHSFALPTISRGTAPFVAAVRSLALTPHPPLPTLGEGESR